MWSRSLAQPSVARAGKNFRLAKRCVWLENASDLKTEKAPPEG
ncbi:hypothetical protein ADIS_0158 [Lunatimonas lonarensis]|uniref:Uncharacterized protein n=1 Tax=Lunatimonas lonarensis TaxID=1232681 RepID=R7ZZ33_9BACT|nr:hypothetical protein ADIS_0158 [Lunatimonas lonarensis]